ncbi:hypothetical protein ACFLTP_00280 [Chloroflexota bacterium]
MGELIIRGLLQDDVKLEWDPDIPDSVEIAEKAFKKNVEKGLKAFRVWDNDKKGKSITEFDKYAERILIVTLACGG